MAVGKLGFSGNLQCPKALLQYCGNRSLPQCCGNALRHCGLLQCAQRIVAMAPLRQYCGNKVLQQYCGNAAAIAMLQQHCGNAHCRYCCNIVAIGGIAAMSFGIATTPQCFSDASSDLM